MTRVLVLSDIHGNQPALDAVLADASDYDRVLVCGDLVGYYPWPGDVVDMIRDMGWTAVRGNHDEAVVTGSTFGLNGQAAAAARYTMGALDEEQTAFLERLPYTWRNSIDGTDSFMVHGSPRAPVEEYVYPDQVNSRFLEDQQVDTDVLLLGHTHVPFTADVGHTLVLNPGSVGQPRDGDPRASYAILNTADGSATVYRTEYDIGEVAEGVAAADLSDALADRLRSGR